MGKVISGLFGGGAKTAALPAPTPVAAAPEPTPMVDEEAIAKKKKEAIARNQARGGRSSTILSGADDTLG